MPPSVSVADVSTTVLRPNSRSRSSPPTASGAARSTPAAGGVGALLGEPDDVVPSRGVRLVEGVEQAERRCRRPRRARTARPCRPAAPSGSSRRSPPSDCLHDTAASRTAVSAPAAARGRFSSAPAAGRRVSAPGASPASTSRSARPGRRACPQRRAAALDRAGGQLAVATPVTRSTSSCASSTITTSCSGSTGMPSSASIASSAWLVTTTSASPGLGAGLLGEALVAERAARRPEALAGADRHLPPRRVGHAGDELVAVAGLGVARPTRGCA